MSKFVRWFGRWSLRSSRGTVRFPQQHKPVTQSFSFDSVDYEEIGSPELRWPVEQSSPRRPEGRDTCRKSFWSRFAPTKLFTRSRVHDSSPKPSPSRSFSWLPGVSRQPSSLGRAILQEELQEDQNQMALWRLNESDLMKRRGYFCATNRPRICACDCPLGTCSAVVKSMEDRGMIATWDARWVFRGGDLERLEEEANERIERMLFY